jgi:hypothetical protein
MKVLKGNYKSSTGALHKAVWLITEKAYVGVADFADTTYIFYSYADFIEDKKEAEAEVSKIFPRVTDFFAQPLKEMTIVFKE